jgi:hypothetical protein
LKPVPRLAARLRAAPHRAASGHDDAEITGDPGTTLSQMPLRSPSGFNAFRHGCTAPDTQSAARGPVAPEGQLPSQARAAWRTARAGGCFLSFGTPTPARAAWASRADCRCSPAGPDCGLILMAGCSAFITVYVNERGSFL